MIFQEPLTSLNPVYTAGNQVAEAVMLHQGLTSSEARQRALEMFELVRIPDPERRLREYPHQMSGGMRQRVMIAMALSCGPKVLIADEPTTALDVTIQAQILGLMRELQTDTNAAVVIITHDMGVVAEVADDVVVMHRSKVVERGSVYDIFERPTQPYTRAPAVGGPQARLHGGPRRPRPVRSDHDRGRQRRLRGRHRMTTADTPLLQVDDLCKVFPVGRSNVHAVEHVSLMIGQGETLAVVGESGCGKSTLAHLVMRLLTPTSGRVALDGTDITALGAKALRPHRRKMQIIFQDPFASLDPRRTVGRAVAEPLKVHGVARSGDRTERVAALFERVGLERSHMDQFPHQFSGGQRQRICIARALALEPSLVVADEAVSALDVSIQAQVINLMLDLQDELGLSYLFISHDLAVVERISHRVAVMYLGQIVELGPRAAVFENPQHPYTRRLLDAVPVADPRRRRERPLLTGEIPSPVWGPGEGPERVTLVEVDPGHFVADESKKS